MRWFYGWNVIGVALLFQAMTHGPTFYSFTLFITAWTEDFGATRGQVMIASVAATLGAGAIAPIAGWFLDRKSIRVCVCLGTTGLASGLALLTVATNVWQVILIHAVLIGQGFVFAGPLAAQTLAAKWFRARRGLAIGWASVGTSIGGFLLPPLVALLMQRFGWRFALLLLAGATIAFVVPAAWLVIADSPDQKGVEPEREDASAPGVAAAAPRWTTTRILASPGFWTPIIVFVPAATAFASVLFNLGPYAHDLGISIPRASVLMSSIAITMVVGKIFFGAMADRWDHRLLSAFGIATLAAGLALLIGRPSFGRLAIVSALLGFAAGSFPSLSAAIVARSFGPAAFGRVMGMILPFIMLAGFGAPIVGWVRDVSGSYDAALRVLFVAVVLGGSGLLLLGNPSGVTIEDA